MSATHLLTATTANGVELVVDGYNDRTKFLSPDDFRAALSTLKDGETIWTEVDEATFDAIHAEYGISIA